MARTKYEKGIQKDDKSYCQWMLPKMRGHKLACCDCGLVHDMDYRIVVVGRPGKDGRRSVEKLSLTFEKPGFSAAVQFKARRNIRATAAKRRERKKRKP